jgi:hypothetical protein
MPGEPNFLTNLKMFGLLDENDLVALAKAVDDLKFRSGHVLRGPHE